MNNKQTETLLRQLGQDILKMRRSLFALRVEVDGLRKDLEEKKVKLS